jgi:putative effector of murein hydrolase
MSKYAKKEVILLSYWYFILGLFILSSLVWKNYQDNKIYLPLVIGVSFIILSIAFYKRQRTMSKE